MEAAGAVGGSFIHLEVGSSQFLTPESFTEEQRMYFRTALQFVREQVLPRAEQLEKKDHGLMRELLARAGELGLLMIDIPEAYGGLALDKTTSMLVAEAQGLQGSWSVTFGGHVGIGTLPIIWFGTEEQKKKYLPRLAAGEWAAAYALTETGSGSDALGARTKALLAADGKHYVFNGSKQFITNAGFADVFVVFAKVDQERFTGFIVERGTPGLTVGPEEHKMGLRGSSTCPLIFEDALVPVENMLGEVGKGHKIAFNVLNQGRLKLGAAALGAMKEQTGAALRYALDRKQFGTPIGKFPLIREKLARMCMLIHAIESMCYRTSGLIDARLAGEDPAAPDHDAKTIAAIEEFSIEASILKVAGSEALGVVADEALQIHGGYGYVEEFPIERAYRDQRVNRIFEGTNEINRMVIGSMFLKRAAKGQLPLLEYARAVADELAGRSLPGPRTTDALAQEAVTAEHLKRMFAYGLKVALERHGQQLERRQEILAALADIAMDAYALDSMVGRTRQAAAGGELDPVRVALCRLYAVEARPRALERARKALCASARGQELEHHLANLALLDGFTPYEPVELREAIVARLEAEGRYPFGDF